MEAVGVVQHVRVHCSSILLLSRPYAYVVLQSCNLYVFGTCTLSALSQFYSEISEAQAWIHEKKPLVTSTDLGQDEDSCQALGKKLDALELDIDAFNNNLGELAALSQGLIDRGHYDSENIAKQQVRTALYCVRMTYVMTYHNIPIFIVTLLSERVRDIVVFLFSSVTSLG